MSNQNHGCSVQAVKVMHPGRGVYEAGTGTKMRKGLISLALVVAAVCGCGSSPPKSAWLSQSDGTPWVEPDGQCVAVRPLTPQDSSGFCYDVMTERYQQKHHYEALDTSEFGFMYPKVEPTPQEALAGSNPPNASELVASTDVQIEPVPYLEQIFTSLPFRFNNAHLSEQNRKALHQSFLDWRAQGINVVSVQVTGHTDTIGPMDYNLQLSKWRAESVVYFLRRIGIPQEDIKLGGAAMLDPHPHAKTKADNRYVDLRVWLKPPAKRPADNKVAAR